MDLFLLFMFHVCLCYAVLSVSCSLMITCWETANLLSILCVAFSCVSIALTYDARDQVWNLILSISDLCLISLH